MKSRRRVLLLILGASSGLAAPGCGRASRDCVPVAGCVTLRGKPLPGAAHVTFAPLSGGPGGGFRPCQVKIGSNGRYQAAYDRRHPGLFPGTYRVGVTCWRFPAENGPGQLEDLSRLESLVPERYSRAATSGLIVEVPADAPRVEFSIDLQ